MTASRAVPPREALIVALDVPTAEAAESLVSRLGESVGFYKIGLELAYGGGLALAERLVGDGKRVFLDLKLHDIPATVERAAAQVARLGATFLTVHAYPQTMAAAKRGVEDGTLQILGVTVLTSYDDADLVAAGYRLGVRDLVALRAEQAEAAGLGGLVLSAEEVAAMRAKVAPSFRLITPGIRPAGSAIGDQKRVMTPAAALRAGADYLVVGRPITRAADPRAAAAAILDEIAAI